MLFKSFSDKSGALPNFRNVFKSRDIFIHDGSGMKRVRISARVQLGAASVAALAVVGAGFGAVQLAVGTSAVSSAVGQFASRQGEVDRMEAELASLQSDLGAIRKTTKTYIARLEARQALLAAAIDGKTPGKDLAMAVAGTVSPESQAAAEFAAMFGSVEADQGKLASVARGRIDARYQASLKAVARLGVHPGFLTGGSAAMGGPYEPVTAGAVTAGAAGAGPGSGKADPQFKALFNSWKRLDQLQQGMASIPSVKPVQAVSINSSFGVRSDPFRGGAAMHSGVDIPGPIGTPIYATADGIVARSGWVGGYGNLVELGHGRGIQTRYGHLSAILVTAGSKVKRGQQIGLMGSTGRSTGSHLHYEVRLEGAAINPVPFLQSSNYLVALQQGNGKQALAVGGPEAAQK